MNPKSAIEKGKLLENYVADQIVAKGLDPKARRDGGSGNGNREKGDIVTALTLLGRNAGIECKNTTTVSMPAWWKQAKKLEDIGREPIVAFKMRGESLEDTKVTIYLDTFLELIKLANASEGIMPQATSSPADQRQLQWAVQDAKRALAKLEKLL